MTLPQWWLTVTKSSTASAPTENPNDQPSNLWHSLKTALDVVQWTPAQAHRIVARQLHDHNGPYYVLKNPSTHTYLRLSSREYWVWSQLDGTHSVNEIIIAYFLDHGTFAYGLVVSLVKQLYRAQMLRERPQFIYPQLDQALKKRARSYRFSQIALALLNRQWNIPYLDDFLDRLYSNGGWLFFTPILQFCFLIMSIAGTFLYIQIIGDARFRFANQNLGTTIIALWLVAIVPVILHELGHVLTMKHYRRDVPRGGFMLNYGFPSTFADTTDILLEGKRARLAVAWAGPYTSILVGSVCAILLWSFPTISIGPLLLQMATMGYVISLSSLNPVFKNDAYHMLSDVFEVNNLRERSFAFWRHKLVPKLIQREPLARDERAFLLLLGITLVWIANVGYLFVVVWRARMATNVLALLHEFGENLTLIVASLVIILTLATIALARMVIQKWGHTVVIQVRNSRLQNYPQLAALIIGLGAIALTLGVWFLLPEAADFLDGILSTAVFVLSTALAFNITRTRNGAIAVYVWGIFIGSLSILGIANILWIINSEWIREFALWLDKIGLVLGLFAGIFGWRSIIGLRGSWRAYSILLLVAGWSSLLMVLPSYEILPFDMLHLFAGLLFLGALAHWQITPRLTILSESSDTHLLTTHAQLSSTFTFFAETLIRQTEFAYGRGSAQYLQKRFDRQARERGWEISFDQGYKPTIAEPMNISTHDWAGLVALALDTLLDETAWVAGNSFARETLARSHDMLDWAQRKIADEYLLMQMRWATKFAEQKRQIQQDVAAMLECLPLFANLTHDEITVIANRLQVEHFAAKENIIRQGDPGDRFYIIRLGHVEVIQTDDQGMEHAITQLANGDYFGETALLTNAPRNATIRTLTPVQALTLHKRDFNRLIRQGFQGHRQMDTAMERVRRLQRIPIFSDFNTFELRTIAAQLVSTSIAAEQIVFHQGDLGDKFYIIEKGAVAVQTTTFDGELVELARLGAGESFGAIALLTNVPRTATIITTQPTTFLTLDANSFNQFVKSRHSVERTAK